MHADFTAKLQNCHIYLTLGNKNWIQFYDSLRLLALRSDQPEELPLITTLQV